MLRPSGAGMVSGPGGQSPANMFPIGPVSNRRSRPHSSPVRAAHIAVHIQVSGWRAWQADGACMIDVPAGPTAGRGLDSALQSGKETPALDIACIVQSTWYKDLQGAGEGPIWSPTHTGARRFSAPYSKSLQGRGQSTSHRPRLPSLIPPLPPSGASLSWRDVSEVVPQPWNVDWKNIMAHNQVYNLTMFRWASCCPAPGSRGPARHPDTAPIRLLPPSGDFQNNVVGPPNDRHISIR